MRDIQYLLELWPVVIAGILFIVWNVRLEAKVLNIESTQSSHYRLLDAKQEKLDSEHTKLEEKMWGRIDSIHNLFNEINTKLTRLETKFEVWDKANNG